MEVRNEFYKEAQGCVLVYDATNRDSFESLERWLEESQRFGAENMVRGHRAHDMGDATSHGHSSSRSSLARIVCFLHALHLCPGSAWPSKALVACVQACVPACKPACLRADHVVHTQVIFVAATKADTPSRKVSEKEGREWAANQGFPFFEVRQAGGQGAGALSPVCPGSPAPGSSGQGWGCGRARPAHKA